MSDFNVIVRAGIEKIWVKDGDTQMKFLENIAAVRNTSASLLKEVGAFFVPNDDYMALYCGDVLRSCEYDCYVREKCLWSNWLVIPVTNVVGEIVGIGGFNPFNYLYVREAGDFSCSYYRYSSSAVFEKGKYLFMVAGTFDRALDEGYLFVTDGLFDCVSLHGAGFNAASLMGSSVTDEIVAMLRFVKRIIVAADNDAAGVKLYKTLKRRLKNVELFSQGKTKDIDEFLCSPDRDLALHMLYDAVERGHLYLSKVKI